MTVYISIDGDDVGNKITQSYLENDEHSLSQLLAELSTRLCQLSDCLRSEGFTIIFCAADGVLAKGEELNINHVSRFVLKIGTPRLTFSAGVGTSLRLAYLALKYAKATGKHRIAVCDNNEQFTILTNDR